MNDAITKFHIENGELTFKRPVTFDDIYENTVEIITAMYPKTTDLIDAMSDQSFDALCIDFREFIVELAKERRMYKEDL